VRSGQASSGDISKAGETGRKKKKEVRWGKGRSGQAIKGKASIQSGKPSGDSRGKVRSSKPRNGMSSLQLRVGKGWDVR